MDLFINNFTSINIFQSNFNIDCIEKLRPILDYIAVEVTRLRVNDPVKMEVTDRILKMLVNYKNKFMSVGGQNMTLFDDQPAIKLVEIYIQFINQLLYRMSTILVNNFSGIYPSSHFQDSIYGNNT